MTSQLLVMIPVTPKEARERLARARQDALALRTEAGGKAKYAAKSQRTRDQVSKLVALAELNDRIAAGCKHALDDAASQPSDQLPTQDPIIEPSVTTEA